MIFSSPYTNFISPPVSFFYFNHKLIVFIVSVSFFDCYSFIKYTISHSAMSIFLQTAAIQTDYAQNQRDNPIENVSRVGLRSMRSSSFQSIFILFQAVAGISAGIQSGTNFCTLCMISRMLISPRFFSVNISI